MDGLDGAAMWCGWGILAHNSFKIAALVERDAALAHRKARPRRPRPAGHGPPPAPPRAA
jgi:hypothetical protein